MNGRQKLLQRLAGLSNAERQAKFVNKFKTRKPELEKLLQQSLSEDERNKLLQELETINRQYEKYINTRQKLDERKSEVANSGAFEGLVSKLATNLATLKMEKKKKLVRQWQQSKSTEFKYLLDKIADAKLNNNQEEILRLVKQLHKDMTDKAETNEEIVSFTEKAKEYNALKDVLKAIANKTYYAPLTTTNRQILTYALREGNKLISNPDITFVSTHKLLKPILKLLEEKLDKEL